MEALPAERPLQSQRSFGKLRWQCRLHTMQHHYCNPHAVIKRNRVTLVNSQYCLRMLSVQLHCIVLPARCISVFSLTDAMQSLIQVIVNVFYYVILCEHI